MRDDSAELELRDYLDILRRHYGIVVLILTLVIGLAVAQSLLQDPSYRSEATVAVRNSENEGLFTPIAGAGYSQNPSSELLLVRSPDFQIQVAEDVSLHADIDEELGLLLLSATAATPEAAEIAATTWAQTYVATRHALDLESTRSSLDTAQKGLERVQLEEDALLEPLQPIEDALEVATDPAVIGQLTTQRLALTQSLDSELNPLRSQRQDLASSIARQELLQFFLVEDPELGAKWISTSGPVDTRAPLSRNVALGLALGLMLGGGAALLFESLGAKLHTEDDISRAVPNEIILGTLPRVGDEVLAYPLNWDAISDNPPFRSALESILTSLGLIAPSSPYSMVITSAEASVGKSMTACSIAMALASLDDSVLLIDGDFRRPRIHDAFAIPRGPGAHEALTRAVPPVDAIHRAHHPDLASLNVMPSGEPVRAPAELLFAHSFRSIGDFPVAHAVTIVDAPPVLPVTDASLIAADVDLTIVVVRAGQTTSTQLKSGIELLRRSCGELAIILVGKKTRDGYY